MNKDTEDCMILNHEKDREIRSPNNALDNAQFRIMTLERKIADIERLDTDENYEKIKEIRNMSFDLQNKISCLFEGKNDQPSPSLRHTPRLALTLLGQLSCNDERRWIWRAYLDGYCGYSGG